MSNGINNILARPRARTYKTGREETKMEDKYEELLERINSKEVDLKQLGENIRFLREAEGLTLQDVALLLGYKTPSVIAKWETGRSRPPIESVVMIGLLFGVSVDFLLTESVTENVCKALNTAPRAPEYHYDFTNKKIKCCPCCGRSLESNGNNGRFCKYCGQEILGQENYGKDVKSFKKNVKKEKKENKLPWDWY